ncbi:hypothetical protein DFH09DRAFT_1145224, partial [Mycena vulgaris]
MPPRARGRKGHLKPDLLLPSRAPFSLPQELIDAIIDEFDISLTDKEGRFLDRKTLRSCALVARAFTRPSQGKLFSMVNLQPKDVYGGQPLDERSRPFSKLLSSTPHIGPYVRTLILSYRCGRSYSLEHILSSLPKLRSLSLHPWITTHWSRGY